MGDGNLFPLVVCIFQVILAYESIVLCMCSGNVLLDIKYSGKYVKIYFNMKITFVNIHSLNT